MKKRHLSHEKAKINQVEASASFSIAPTVPVIQTRKSQFSCCCGIFNGRKRGGGGAPHLD